MMPYPDNFSSAAYDAAQGRDDDPESCESRMSAVAREMLRRDIADYHAARAATKGDGK